MSKCSSLVVLLTALTLAACASKQTAETPASGNTAGAKAEAGKPVRTEVKGINDWTGYVSGTPARGSKFSRLKVGMSMNEIYSVAGYPSDQYAHPTGKAWIPFYYGSGKYERVLLYKGVGRLIMTSNASFTSGLYLVGIEHDASERGFQ